MKETGITTEQLSLILSGANHSGRIYETATRFSSIYGLYAYPARFSPVFVRRVLSALSKPGEIILDPFLGSGTTVYESLKMGHSGIGIDASPISMFLNSRALRGTSAGTLEKAATEGARIAQELADEKNLGRYLVPLWPVEHDNDEEFRQLASTLEEFVWRGNELRGETAKLLQAVALSAGQWAIDGRREPVSRDALVERLQMVSKRLPIILMSWNQLMRESWGDSRWKKHVTLLGGDAERVLKAESAELAERVGISITSPPYPGVHVLYAKWQLRGRRETNLPAYIIGADVAPESAYTMGPRNSNGDEYFARMSSIANSMAAKLRHGAFSVQLVGFKNVDSQLQRYVETYENQGFEEITKQMNIFSESLREVPSRKWHATHLGELDTKKEKLLIFRKV